MILPSRFMGQTGCGILLAKHGNPHAPQGESVRGKRPSFMNRFRGLFTKDREDSHSNCDTSTDKVSNISDIPGETFVSQQTKWPVWKRAQNFQAFRRVPGVNCATSSKAPTITMTRSIRRMMRDAAYRPAMPQKDEVGEELVLGSLQSMPKFMRQGARVEELQEVVAVEGSAMAGTPAHALLRQRQRRCSGQVKTSLERGSENGLPAPIAPHMPEGLPVKNGRRFRAYA